MAQTAANVTARQPRRRQTARTKADFVQALWILMQERQFSQIKVDDLAKKAGYSRRTFYRHFQTVTDVVKLKIKSEVLSLFDDLRANSQDNPSFSTTVTTFFTYWQKETTLLFLLRKQGLLYLLPAVTSENIAASSLPQTLAKENQEPVDMDYLLSFALAGMYSLLETWLRHGAQPSPVEMGRVAEQISSHLQPS